MEKNREYYESLDRRTTEYKEWKESQTVEVSQGFGDTVEKVFKATGIKKLVESIFGDDCTSCDERRKKLNAILPYAINKLLTEDEYNYLAELFNTHKKLDGKNFSGKFNPSSYKRAVDILSRIRGVKPDYSTGCGSCVRDNLNTLYQVYETYEAQ